MPGGSSKGGKASKGKNDAPMPTGVLQRGVWSVDRNNTNGLKYDDVEPAIKAIAPTGEFNADYTSFCEVLNLVPHPQLVLSPVEPAPKPPPVEGAPPAEDDEPAAMIRVKNTTLDLGSSTAFFCALPTSTTCTDLCFYNAALSPSVISELAGLLEQTNVARVRIEYNFRSGAEAVDVGSEDAKGGEEKGGEEGGVVSCLTELIAAQSVVKELSLRGNELDSLAGVAIARAVANNSSLKMLNLFDNRLGDEGAVAIAKALRFNMSMSCVSLCKNGVGDEGALAFAAVFQHLGETDELAEARATATAAVDARNKWVGEFNKKMKKLKLTTELDPVTPPPAAVDGPDGPESVGNSVLELLNLSANSIGPAAGLELAKAIGAARTASETSMHGLALHMNAIDGDADVDAIDELLSPHQGFVLEI